MQQARAQLCDAFGVYCFLIVHVRQFGINVSRQQELFYPSYARCRSSHWARPRPSPQCECSRENLGTTIATHITAGDTIKVVDLLCRCVARVGTRCMDKNVRDEVLQLNAPIWLRWTSTLFLAMVVSIFHGLRSNSSRANTSDCVLAARVGPSTDIVSLALVCCVK